MLTGLVSVTFRKMTPAEIVRITRKAGLDGIEWGSDVHCPPGDTTAAREIATLMAENGLATISYGSYYQVGVCDHFDSIIDTAVTLRTTNIRVWAGSVGSIMATKDDRRHITEDSRRIARLAAERGLTISYEFHGESLTDSITSTVQLLNDINMDNVFSYWQPLGDFSFKENIENLRKLVVMRKLKNIHMFEWTEVEKMPLISGQEKWLRYIEAALPCSPALLLEFVKGDDIQQFFEDAKTLKSIKARCNCNCSLSD